MRVEIRCRAGLCCARLHHSRGQPGINVEREIFDGFVVGKSRTLPTGCRAALDHEQSRAATIKNCVVEKGAQDFLLSGSRLNGRNRFLESGGTGSLPRLAGQRGPYLAQNFLYYGFAQRRELTLQCLRNGATDDLFDTIFGHISANRAFPNYRSNWGVASRSL